jgi:hypothetical protein
MSKYLFPLYFVCLFLDSTLAMAGGKSIHCQTVNDPDFLKMAVGADGRFHLETKQTRRFLIGLSCEFPIAETPIFYCKGSGSQYGEITFSSALVHEVGFPKDTYGKFVDRHFYVFQLRFPYEDSNGEYKQAERTWKFQQSDCQAGEQ